MTDKNIADVADKAVDKLSGGIEAVARAVEKVAPHVWEVLVRQAFTEGVVSTATGALALLATACVTRFFWRKLPKGVMDEPYAPVLMFPAIGVVCLVIFGFAELRDGSLRLLNPEYYAAKQLIESAK